MKPASPVLVLNDREMKRLVRVWEKKCREDSRPLLGEWVPPTEKNFYLARSLGGARAWVEILLVQKARYGGARQACRVSIAFTDLAEAVKMKYRQSTSTEQVRAVQWLHMLDGADDHAQRDYNLQAKYIHGCERRQT